jgi:hypothetical protein
MRNRDPLCDSDKYKFFFWQSTIGKRLNEEEQLRSLNQRLEDFEDDD